MTDETLSLKKFLSAYSYFVPHPSSYIPRPSTLIPRPSSFILHPSSFILHPSSFILELELHFGCFAFSGLFDLKKCFFFKVEHSGNDVRRDCLNFVIVLKNGIVIGLPSESDSIFC